MYTYCSTIIKGSPFHALKCPSLENKLDDHCLQTRFNMNIRLFLGTTHDASGNLSAFNERLQTNSKLDLAWHIWEKQMFLWRNITYCLSILLPVCLCRSRIFVFPSCLPLISILFCVGILYWSSVRSLILWFYFKNTGWPLIEMFDSLLTVLLLKRE